MKKLKKFGIAMAIAGAMLVAPFSVSASTYQDVDKGFWAYDIITELSKNHIIDGNGNGLFHPNSDIRRDTTAVWLAKALELDTSNAPDPNFSDVSKSDPAYPYIAAVTEAGIFDGRDGKFAPSETLTRAQMAKVLVESFNLVGKYDQGFKDIRNTFWGVDYISRLAASEVTTGYNDLTYRPSNSTTRAQLAVFLHRAINPEIKDWSKYREKEIPKMSADEARKKSLNELKRLYPQKVLLRAGGKIEERTLIERYYNNIQSRPKYNMEPHVNIEFVTNGMFGSSGISMYYPNEDYIHVDGIAYAQHPRFSTANVRIPDLDIEDPKSVFPRSPSNPGHKLVDIYFREKDYGIYTNQTPTYGSTSQIRKTISGSATIDGQTIFGEFGIVFQDKEEYIFLVNGNELRVKPNNHNATFNGSTIQLKTKPYMDQEAKNTIMVPLVEVANLLDLELKIWSSLLRVELTNYPNR